MLVEVSMKFTNKHRTSTTGRAGWPSIVLAVAEPFPRHVSLTTMVVSNVVASSDHEMKDRDPQKLRFGRQPTAKSDSLQKY